MSPVEFIPIVEDMGLMSQLGEWVIRTACQNGVKWLKAGYDVPRIAVNVS
jgi:EAL domain-containing protein (putative c-di-GMP-specific phosphodiesterase class I)